MSVLEWCEKKLDFVSTSYDKNLDELAKLTIVILTYGRHDFVYRQFVYWKDTPVTLLFLDGSKNSIPESVLEKLKTHNNIKYHHMPLSIAERLNFAAKNILTKYAVSCGDDDFLLKQGLVAAVEELEKNSEIGGCIGQSLRYFLDDKYQCTYGPGYLHWRYEVLDEDLDIRLKKAMSSYNAATCYAVFRSEIWADGWGNMLAWSSPYVWEMKQAFATYISCKFKAIDEVYWMRSDENTPVSLAGSNRDNTFIAWWYSDKFSNEHESFLDNLTNQAKKHHPDVSQSELKKTIRENVNYFSELELNNKQDEMSSQSKVLSVRSTALKIFKKIVGESLYLSLKAISSNFKKRPELKGSCGTLDQVKNIPINNTLILSPTDIIGIDEMQNLILEFYKERTKGKQDHGRSK